MNDSYERTTHRPFRRLVHFSAPESSESSMEAAKAAMKSAEAPAMEATATPTTATEATASEKTTATTVPTPAAE